MQNAGIRCQQSAVRPTRFPLQEAVIPADAGIQVSGSGWELKADS
jgi:hypothetical protein